MFEEFSMDAISQGIYRFGSIVISKVFSTCDAYFPGRENMERNGEKTTHFFRQVLFRVIEQAFVHVCTGKAKLCQWHPSPK